MVVLRHLLSMHDAVSSIPNTMKQREIEVTNNDRKAYLKTMVTIF